MTLCEVRIRGQLCGNPARFKVTTLADAFLVCEEHVAKWRVRPTAKVEVIP